jgi:hypothetical protein
LDPNIDAKFRAAALVFEELGAVVEEISVPMHEISSAIFAAASRQVRRSSREILIYMLIRVQGGVMVRRYSV